MSRETWGNRASFLLACIGSAVGLGNIWRFPYLCYKSGGGAFLIPYIIMLILCGLPLLFMELTMGQYTRQGPIGALGKICPLLQGTGIATVVISFWLCTYYNVIISWAMFYLVSSFQDPLPWTGCGNWWNTESCWDVQSNTTSDPGKNISSSQEYFDHRVLQMSSGIEDYGSINMELLGFLILAWVIVYFCIWKSVKTTGKVVFFTATFPYLLLMAFLIRGLTLPGAMEGIKFFIEPQWDKMLESKVWIYAAAQVFNSIGIAFGCLVAFSSYNPFHGPILKDTLIVVVVDAFTCIICGLCVFSTMGNLALEQGKTVDDVIADGPGLVFVVFPHALAKMPVPQLWSSTFFFMLILLGIDSQFATVEVIITTLKDGFSDWIDRYIKYHEVLVLLVCILGFLFGIPHVFNGGIYLFQIVDYYAAAMSLMYIAFFECVAVLWIYGTKRMSANIKDMTGSYPNIIYRVCWRYISPLLIFAIWIFSVIDYKEPTYNKDTYSYPKWAITLGWCISATSLVPIPINALYKLLTAKSSYLIEKIKMTLQTTIVECPCGCDSGLDENHEAHANSTLSLIKGGCDKDFEAMKDSNTLKKYVMDPV